MSIDLGTLARYAHLVLPDAAIPELPNPYHGKVRENYDLADGSRLLIATDRLSAFDRILTAIPLKGQVLTQLARFWFQATADLCPNHVLEYPDPAVVRARRLSILPVEIVVRDYLAGSTGTSIWPMYRSGARELYGIRFPDGMRENQKLDQTIITPTSKAYDGEHDAPLSESEILGRGLLTPAQWGEVRERALALFDRGRTIAAARGLILVDTKYEFGLDPAGRILLADEIHTPDSSRYWFADSYPQRFADGTRPQSFDKDVVRAWVVGRCDPYRDEIPPIPPEIVLHTAGVYIGAYERITGQAFDWPDPDEPVLARIRRHLARFMERG